MTLTPLLARAKDDDYDDELALAAVLLLLAQRHPAEAHLFALMAADAAKDAKLAVKKLSADVAKAVETAATKADAAYHAALTNGATEAEAAEAFGVEMRSLLGDVLSQFGLAESEMATRLDLILSQEILTAWNDGNYSGVFADPGGHWQFHTEGDKKVCPYCKRLEGRIFRNDDADAGRLLPMVHFGDRCWATKVSRDVERDEVSDGTDFLYCVAEGFDYDKRSGTGI